MKRLIPSSLITFWQHNRNAIKADCFVIQLTNGQTLCATEGQWDITFRTDTPGWLGPQTTFYSTRYGVWTRGAITSEATTTFAANTMDLTCTPQQDTLFPGLTTGILNAARANLFDAATVSVYTAYMPLNAYGDVSAGIEAKWQGTITSRPKVARNLVQFQCADPLFLLNMKIPTRLFQSNCPWSFCDANCRLNAADYTVSFTADASSTSRTLTPASALSQPDGYFAQGVVKCTGGANVGLSQTVKTHSGGSLALVVAWLLPVAAGDTFEVIKGCDKTLTMCKTTAKPDGSVIDNSINNGSTPFVPPPSTAV